MSQFTLIQNGDVYAPEPIGRPDVLMCLNNILKVGDVDQKPRRLQPQRQRRHEALAAGNETRIVPGARMSVQRLVDRRRTKIAESPRLHCRFPEIHRLISRDARFVTIWSQNPDTPPGGGQQEMTIWSQMHLWAKKAAGDC